MVNPLDSLPAPPGDPRNLVSPLPPPAAAPVPLTAPEGDAFPSMLQCCFTLCPPQRAVYLDIRGPDGQTPKQVFEFTAVFRQIATTGVYTQFRKVRHPITGGFIDRRLALALVVDVPPEVQTRITRERILRRLPPVEPLNEDDHEKYSTTIARMENSTVDPCEYGADDIGNEMEGLVGVVLPRSAGRSPADFAAR
jgi:hypothetical protein